MKKILIGCGVAALLGVLVCLGFGIWGGLKVQRAFSDMEAAFESVGELEQKYPFTEPEGFGLTAERLDRYFRARDSMMTKVEAHPVLGPLLAAEDPAKIDLGPMKMASLMISLPTFGAETLAGGLDPVSMGPSEYIWTMRAVAATIVQGARQNDPQMASLLEAMEVELPAINEAMDQAGQGTMTSDMERAIEQFERQQMSQDVLRRNIGLLTPHRQKITSRARLSLLELSFSGEIQNHLAEMLQAQQQMGTEAGE